MNKRLIYAEDAIDALDALCDRECEYSKKQRSVMCGACRLGSAFDVIDDLPSAQPEIIRCKDCKNSEHWYRDKCRCFLWAEDGIDVFDDGFCNYAERRQEADSSGNMSGTQKELERTETHSCDCERTATHEWILCSERMPEEHEWMGTKRFGTTISNEVYVTFENPKGERFCKHLSFQNGKLSAFDQSTIDAFYKGSKPIAWMPLPEPYKERQDD